MSSNAKITKKNLNLFAFRLLSLSSLNSEKLEIVHLFLTLAVKYYSTTTDTEITCRQTI